MLFGLIFEKVLKLFIGQHSNELDKAVVLINNLKIFYKIKSTQLYKVRKNGLLEILAFIWLLEHIIIK